MRMFYHRSLNLGEIIQGFMVGKVRKGIGSKYFLNCDYNFSSMTKVKWTFVYEGEYIACCVVCKVTCRLRLSVYVGKNQNTLKNRIKEHFQDVSQKAQHDKKSDTFAANLDQHLIKTQPPNSVVK